MSMFTKLEPLTKIGVVVHITVRGGEGQMQIELVSQTKDSKIQLPARAYLGTAEELDSHLGSILHGLVQPLASLTEQMAQADAAVQQAVQEAKASAESKIKRTLATSSYKAPAKRKSQDAGFIQDDDANGHEDEDDGVQTNAPSAQAPREAAQSGTSEPQISFL